MTSPTPRHATRHRRRSTVTAPDMITCAFVAGEIAMVALMIWGVATMAAAARRAELIAFLMVGVSIGLSIPIHALAVAAKNNIRRGGVGTWTATFAVNLSAARMAALLGAVAAVGVLFAGRGWLVGDICLVGVAVSDASAVMAIAISVGRAATAVARRGDALIRTSGAPSAGTPNDPDRLNHLERRSKPMSYTTARPVT
jgi:hypothetical protein